jgi:hypothetical protein
MKRLPDWESRLSAFLDEWSDVQYAYGKADCARFAAEAAQAQTGHDYYAPFRDKYTTKTGSIKTLKTIGAGDLESTFSQYFVERELSFARRGDIVFDGEAVGICYGRSCLFVGTCDQQDGLVQVHLHECVKAWAVGDE